MCCLPGKQTYGHWHISLLILKDLRSKTSKELSHPPVQTTRTVLLSPPLKTSETSTLNPSMVKCQRDQNIIVIQRKAYSFRGCLHVNVICCFSLSWHVFTYHFRSSTSTGHIPRFLKVLQRKERLKSILYLRYLRRMLSTLSVIHVSPVIVPLLKLSFVSIYNSWKGKKQMDRCGRKGCWAPPHFISNCKIPGKKDCDSCLRAEPVALKDRDWLAVKYYVHNKIIALKRNMNR